VTPPHCRALDDQRAELSELRDDLEDVRAELAAAESHDDIDAARAELDAIEEELAAVAVSVEDVAAQLEETTGTANASDAVGDTVDGASDAVNDSAESAVDAARTSNVSVGNASAGETVSVNTSAAATDDVGVSALNVSVERDGGFTLNVTAADEPLNGTPAYERDDGGVGLGNIRVGHSIDDANISNVSFTFSLSDARLAERNATPEEVALYRYHDGSWNALETEYVGAEGDRHVFRAVSPGLSDFTAAAQKPSFELTQTLVDPTEVRVGQSTDIRVRIKNVGDADGSYTAELLFDNESVAVQQVSVAADGIRQVSFEETPDAVGEYETRVNEVLAGTLTVQAAETATAEDGSTAESASEAASTPAGTTSSSAPGFGAVGALLAVALGLVALRRP